MKSVNARNKKKISSKAAKSLLVGLVGLSSINMVGCEMNIDEIVAGITSNVCVLAGECNGSTYM